MKIIKRTGFAAAIALLLFACHNTAPTEEKAGAIKLTDSAFRSRVKYARGFKIRYTADSKIIELTDPWDTTKIMVTYVFIPRGSNPEKKVQGAAYIEIPVSTMACQFTPQIGFAQKLGILNKITGMSRPDFIFNKSVRELIDSKKIALFGEPNDPDVERLLAINPEILVVSPFKDNRYEKVRKSGITLAIDASYMEESPLGRAEWIKFIASFFALDNSADRIFDSIADRYLEIKDKVARTRERPTIFNGKKFQDNWFIAGGKSYMAQFLNDAGFDYIWNDIRTAGSIPMDFESVYQRAANCQYWSFIESKKGIYSYEEIQGEFAPYSDFLAFRDRHILMCNVGETPYYESGIMEPDIILSDFVKIAHPELLPDYKPVYFKLLK
jgi:iron complex transport system substrate-binding protein